jgi:hypothetical protein
MCGVGLRDPLADFVLPLWLPPALDPLLGDSALGGVDMIKHTVETEGSDHGQQDGLYSGGFFVSILPLDLITSVVTGHRYSLNHLRLTSRSIADITNSGLTWGVPRKLTSATLENDDAEDVVCHRRQSWVWR